MKGSIAWVILLIMAWIFLMLIWLFFSALRAECETVELTLARGAWTPMYETVTTKCPVLPRGYFTPVGRGTMTVALTGTPEALHCAQCTVHHLAGQWRSYCRDVR